MVLRCDAGRIGARAQHLLWVVYGVRGQAGLMDNGVILIHRLWDCVLSLQIQGRCHNICFVNFVRKYKFENFELEKAFFKTMKTSSIFKS